MSVRQSPQKEIQRLKTFTIENETNNITVQATTQDAEAVANAERFRNEAGLNKLVADWPAARLVEIWNSLPGVSPVKKFTDLTDRCQPDLESASEPGSGRLGPRRAVVRSGRLLRSRKPSKRLSQLPLFRTSREPPTATPVAGQKRPTLRRTRLPSTKKTTTRLKAPKESRQGAPRESKTAQVVAMLSSARKALRFPRS